MTTMMRTGAWLRARRSARRKVSFKLAGRVVSAAYRSGVEAGAASPAERAVLDAVRAWVDGDGTTLAIENAYSLLAALDDR